MKIKYTNIYEKWYESLKDDKVKATISRRINRLKLYDHFGDCKHIGGKIYEMRFFLTVGYRIYFAKKQKEIVILLCGGDKDTQQRDIEQAKHIYELLREQE